jgi:predicted permease
MLTTIVAGARYSLRALARERTFTIVAVVSVATGVGATTALFSIVNALWLRPLAVSEPERVGFVYSRPVRGGADGERLPGMPLRAARDFRHLPGVKGVAYQVQPLTPLLEWTRPRVVLASLEELESQAVSADYFDLLGVRVTGRSFVAAESEGDAGEAVIGAALARRLFGSTAGALGQLLPTTRGPLTVVGVAPDPFRGPRLGDRVEVWMPLAAVVRFSHFPDDMIDTLGVAPIVRLAAGARWADIAPRVGELTSGRGHITPLSDVRFLIRSDGALVRQGALLSVLWITTALIMCAGCTNLAAVLFARAERRRHELAVRMSVGASRRDLVWLVAGEGVLLSAAAVPVALLIAWGVIEGLSRFALPGGMPLAHLGLAIDWRVAAFAIAMTILGVALAGIMPARCATTRGVAAELARTRGGGDRTSVRIRQVLLATHVALSLTLLTAAATLVGKVAVLLRTDQGLSIRHTFIVSVAPSFAEYAIASGNGAARQEQDYAALVERIAMLPGVDVVSHGGAPVPVDRDAALREVRSPGTSVAIPALVVPGGPRYAAAVGARLVEGRDLSRADLGQTRRPGRAEDRDAPPAGVLIELSAARRLWPDAPAVGRTLEIGGRTVQVVGVVDDVLAAGKASLQLPLVVVGREVSAEVGQRIPAIVVRAAAEQTPLAGQLEALAREAFLGRPVVEVRRVDALIQDAMANEYIGAAVFSGFGTAGAVLGVAGVYGLVLFVVARARRDLAVRSFLGATDAQLTLSAIRQPMLPVLLGILAGMGLSHAGARLLDASIVGLDGVAPWAHAAAGGTFFAAAAIASWYGARGIRGITLGDALRD